ncbi:MULTISPECIES: AMP-binding protein [unclassified Rhodococcus (in: high G+C Gram-positive bacteria)]|uniref:AMP-binding protein n=1 Tax=unclassified Rhodococcus (in: high G+C Gram-positive bacteria) TaxID=192944 RepID=UPI0012E359C3|nr:MULTISPECIES: AMP-binding protein [unclassified Rhodococcus (in: high G+C Gram-positive bacteria)]
MTDPDLAFARTGNESSVPAEPFMNIASALHTWGRTRPGRTAVRIDDTVLTYDGLDTATAALAGGLLQLGVAKGERIVYLSAYRREVLLTVLATYRLGAVNVVLNEYLKGDSLRHQLVDAAPSVIVVDSDGLSMLATLALDVPELRTVVVLDDGTSHPLPGVPFDLVAWSTVASGPLLHELELAGPDDPAQIVYTSGTTGLPKGCVLSQRYLLHQGEVFGPWSGLRDDDVYMSSAPLYHVSGIHVLTTGLIAGAEVVVVPRFSASAFWDRVRRYGVTAFHGLGFTTLALLGQPPRDDDREHPLRFFWSGAAPHEAKEEFENRFGVRVIGGGYGQTEFNPVAMVQSDYPPGDRNSMGRPLDHVELRLTDDSGNDVPDGEVGEIVLRPTRPGVMFTGYWRQPEATLKTWRDLWHRTGDLARYDVTGNLQFAGRANDSMRRRGENVSAFQVEHAISKFPAVREVAVFGVRIDTEVDDCIKADIVVHDRSSFTIEEFAEFVNVELPYYATPRFIEIVDALPRNASGRITKHTLNRSVTDSAVVDLHESGLAVSRHARRSAPAVRPDRDEQTT